MGDWYYIGHYGQLGPLTREQIDELVTSGVIARDTYVWRNGMTDWIYAERCPDLLDSFQKIEPVAAPPPPRPMVEPPRPSATTTVSTYEYALRKPSGFYPSFGLLKSDRSRLAAGFLQIFLPGVGRMYLGYFALGLIQLVLTLLTCGFLWPWSFVDGIMILTGSVRLDGYGRQLTD